MPGLFNQNSAGKAGSVNTMVSSVTVYPEEQAWHDLTVQLNSTRDLPYNPVTTPRLNQPYRGNY